MMDRLRTAALGFLAFLVAGCASVPMASVDKDAKAKTFATQPGTANIYLYRNERFGGNANMEIFLDNNEIAATLGKTYIVLEVAPGAHTIMASSGYNSSDVNLIAEAGKNYFVWQEIKFGMELDYFAPRTLLHLVDQETGEAGVKECELIDTVAYQKTLLHCPGAKACSFGHCTCE
jgi:Protein of unknown function (DUF2846)